MKDFELLNKATLTKHEIVDLLKINDVEKNKLIKIAVEKIKILLPKDSHQFEETIELSNNCDADCIFCQSRSENIKINRFRLNREEIIEEALKLYKLGKQSIILHSGYDKFYNTDRIAYIIYSIKKRTNLKLTLSFGLREFNEYKAWKIAGADSYLLNFVSSNKELYKQTNSWGYFEDRLEHLEELRRLGYNIGSGSILGLPNQTLDDIANDILFCKGLDVDFIDFCYYNLLNGNELDNSVNKLLSRVVEVAQLVIPKRNVRLNNLIS